MKAYLMIPLAIGLLVGCAKQDEEASAKPTKSSATLAIEGITGKTAVDAGQRARAQIKAISAQHESDLQDAAGDAQ
jgi:hypothetical protein